LFHAEQRRRPPPSHDEPQTNKGADAHLMEEDMNKSLIALLTAAVAIAATVSHAEAGFHFRIGFGPIGYGAFNHGSDYGSYHAPRRIYRAERAPVRAHKAQPTSVAKEEDKKAEKSVAQNENSSIAVAAPAVASVENSSITIASEPVKITETKKTAEAAKAIEPVKTAETKKSAPAVAQKLDCKKFFPSVGLTLTVPCE
jgi:hypothetical protein